MKGKWKRLVALMMALSMLTVLLQTNVSAAGIKEEESQSILKDVSDVTMEGSDSVGMLLSDAFSEAEEEYSKLEEQNAYISDLEIVGNQADVTYYTEKDAEIVVAVYDEETKQMLASGKVSVPNDSETQDVVVTIEGNMPQYYNVSVYMLDSKNHEPLCESYSTNIYNRAMQKLETSTVADYNAEQVLNLDEDDKTNFVVYGGETKIIRYSADTNRVTDNGDGTYIIENTDSDFTDLHIGDIFSYSYQDGSVLIVKVKSISVDGTTVTITEDEDINLESVFDYVKIEGGVKNPPEPELELYHARKGATLESSTSFTASIDKKFFDGSSLDGSRENSCSIKGSLNIYGYVKAYISLRDQHIEAKASISLSGELELKGSCRKKEVELLPEAPYLTICPGVFMSVNPVFVIEFSASLKTGVTVSAAAGVKYDSDSGARNISEKPSLKGEFKAEGAVFIGFKPSAEAYILSDAVGGVSISAEAGLKLAISYAKEAAAGASEKHQCNACLSGKLSAEFKLAAKIEVIGNAVFEHEVASLTFPEILECYYSLDYGEFAWTACPHKAYRITVRVKDEKGNALGGVTVVGDGFDLGTVTNSSGTADFYLPNGSYDLVLTKGKNMATAQVVVDGKAKDVAVTMQNGDTGIVASGQCGYILTWQLDENGLLVISTDESDQRNEWWSGGFGWRNYSKDIKAVIIEDGITSIPNSAFEACKNLTTITIPPSVTSIEYTAFWNCSSLMSITLPENLTSIGHLAFAGCSKLMDITFSPSITSIGSDAFYGCSSLTSIVLPSGVTSIEEKAFYNCSSLTSITLPSSITSIGSDAFYGCSSLTNITLPSSITSIGSDAFHGCSSLTSITLPPNITSIESGTFRACRSLASITLPLGLTSIKSYTFDFCESLTSIEIPLGVTSIGRCAFSYCYSLTSIKISSGVRSIESETFRGCRNLRSITIPLSVTYIGDSVFDGCWKLSDVYYRGSEEDWKAISIKSSDALLSRATKHFNYNGFGESGNESGGNGSGEGGNEGGGSGSGEGGNESGGNDGSEKSISRVSLNSVTTLLDGLPVGFSGTVYLQDGTTASKAEWADIINSITWSISDTYIVDDFTCRWIESLSETNYCELILGVTPIGVGTATITGTLPDGTKVSCTVTVNALDDAVDAIGISDISVVSQNASDNVHIGNINESGIRKTVGFADLIPNNLYVILVVKQADADDLLAADNLIYIVQEYADVFGNLTLDYVPRTDDNSVVLAYGYKETEDPSDGEDDSDPEDDNTQTNPPIVKPDDTQINPPIVKPNNTTRTKINRVTLKQSSFTYNGKKQTPDVTVQAGTITLVKVRDYTVSYANNVNVGQASVIVRGIGKYAGTMTKVFEINPKGTSISKKITAKSKGFLVKWKKQTVQTTGYEIQYSTNKKFTNKTTQTKTVKKASKAKLSVNKLKAKKKYYVRIRTYQTVKGKKYYSGWSKCKSVTTKKVNGRK